MTSISCTDADALAAALSVGSLDGEDRAALELHLSGCADCRRVAGEYMAAAARLPLALDPVQPPPELRGRLMRAVYAEAAQAGRDPARARSASRWRRAWRAFPASRGLTAVAAAAALVLIGVSSWVVVTRQAAAPSSVAVILSATHSAPLARGDLRYEKGSNQAVLTLHGLPSPASLAKDGAVYEVWLLRADGTPVPAAYLTKNPDGSWTAALHGDMTTYAGVAATVEPAGGSPVPTGVRVITGLLRAT